MICYILAACFLILNLVPLRFKRVGRRPWQSLKLPSGWSPIFQGLWVASFPWGKSRPRPEPAPLRGAACSLPCRLSGHLKAKGIDTYWCSLIITTHCVAWMMSSSCAIWASKVPLTNTYRELSPSSFATWSKVLYTPGVLKEGSLSALSDICMFKMVPRSIV